MKPNTYTKLYAHLIFTPKGRDFLLKNPIRDDIQKYIYGIIKGLDCYPVIINGMPDHIHILTGFVPTISISELMRDIKRSSSLFINENDMFPFKFSWQEGYGAFTVGYRELDIVYNYILRQEEHHLKASFRKEYYQTLEENGVDYINEYLFEFYE